MDNMKLWHSVCVTDPKAVKPITGKQYKGNSPKPYWVIQRATEVFGPCGLGWGVQILSERFERFGADEALHIAHVRVWYVQDGKRGEVEQMGQTRAAYTTAQGKFIVDEDAPKKSATDGMVKCLSMLGFAGDIFSGRWDDSKYVAHALEVSKEREARANMTPEQAAEQERLQKRGAELDELSLYLVEAHNAGKDMDAIRVWYAADTWAQDAAERAEEQKYVWGNLKAESALRSAIKANSPSKLGPN